MTVSACLTTSSATHCCQPCAIRRGSASRGARSPPRPASQRARRGLACRGFLSGLFGSGGGSGGATVAEPGVAEDYSLENLDEVLLTELQAEDGSQRYIVYRNGGLVDAAELEALCDKVGWPRRPQNKVQAALANSFLVATLTLEDAPPRSSSSDCSDGSSSGSGSGSPPTSSRPASSSSGTPGRLIGLARCTSDGAFNATLWDVLVDPEFQGQGLGKALVEGVTRTLLKRDITNITLFADSAGKP
ncbi:hypothetical protein CHLNCDRAFT_57286 [Chlorella variabilis]|uniref:N-acetyltransferase domain-containing protein n=1 Tax=Chlorella variabilis TaxID=554065 RepID=E1Z9G2_CHLVA|nr:hypothetical protein CHLNCDRAFT_57286 [Chlorella variabilis]EFN57513.1 hypothetical protein CHLNCDRAFT_57286 [Chlorella variabilis]|eukprot:XP_005849615.1 hypothetical protein CHLNCDRAFT_57286 [Chlorella variabilis]